MLPDVHIYQLLLQLADVKGVGLAVSGLVEPTHDLLCLVTCHRHSSEHACSIYFKL
jgi:hypothetical protein